MPTIDGRETTPGAPPRRSRAGRYKTMNPYALGRDFYHETPKAVFAAIAYSYCSAGGDADDATSRRNFLNEWRILFENGIVPQRPPKAEEGTP